MRSGVGCLVDAVRQRQVRLSLPHQDQHVPGNQGETATPTAAVVFSLLAQGIVVQSAMGQTVALHIYGLQPSPLTVCEARGMDRRRVCAPSPQTKSWEECHIPLNVGRST
jgi:hypothetical protein